MSHRRVNPNQFVDTPRSILSARRMRRRVRVSIAMKPDLLFDGRQNDATYAYADLDDAQVDHLIRRLTAIRGGRQAL